MRPMLGLMNVIFIALTAEQPVLLLVDLAARDDVADGGGREVEGREAHLAVENPQADRTPAVEAPARLEDAGGELFGAHPARLEDRVAVAVVGVEPPARR